MKYETKDHGLKPLTKRFADVQLGEFFQWQGWQYRHESCGIVLCIDDLRRQDWSYQEAFDREVTMVSPPDWDQWLQAVHQHFKPKTVKPATTLVSTMPPGQVFVFPGEIDGVVNGVFIAGDHGSITRLSDGKVFTDMGATQGIPINGKFVEEGQTA